MTKKASTPPVIAPIDPKEGLPLDANEVKAMQEVLAILGPESAAALQALPYELLPRFIRGYMGYKDRVREMTNALTATLEFRRTMNADTILNRPLPNQKEFYEAWPSFIYGTDPHGHLILADRLASIDMSVLEKLPVEDILNIRLQYQEVVESAKAEAGIAYGVPRPKQVYIIDLQGVSPNKHFSRKVRAFLKPMLANGSNNYPETLAQVFIINAPKLFLMVWKVIQAWIDPITLKKIKILGGSDAYLKEMDKCGISREQIPEWMGGLHPGTNIVTSLERIMRSRGWDGTYAAGTLGSLPADSQGESGDGEDIADDTQSTTDAAGPSTPSKAAPAMPIDTPNTATTTTTTTAGAVVVVAVTGKDTADAQPVQTSHVQEHGQDAGGLRKSRIINSFMYLENRIASFHRRGSFQQFEVPVESQGK